MFSLYKERESFLALDECYQLIENVISDDLSNFPILLIGAKADENERVTNSKEAIDFSKKRILLAIMKFLHILVKTFLIH